MIDLSSPAKGLLLLWQMTTCVSRRWVLVRCAAGVAVTLLLLHGAARRPADPGELLPLYSSEFIEPSTCSTFRVGTFNIHSGKGTDRRRDLNRTAESLRDLDFVALQEVRGSVVGLPKNQAETLGRRLDMAWIYAPTQTANWHERFGNAILTRRPIASHLRIPLVSTQPRRPRNVLLANLVHCGHTVHIISAHIDNLRDRDTQLHTLVDLFLALEEPALLMGDLNADATHPGLRRLLGTPGVVDALASAPNRSKLDRPIDWILVRGLRVLRADVFDNGASDHPAMRAELEVIVREKGSRSNLQHEQLPCGIATQQYHLRKN